MHKMVKDHVLAQAIVDTIREPLLVLDQDLRVVAASRSFYVKFRAEGRFIEGVLLSALGEGRWDIPALHVLLKQIASDKGVMEDYEVEFNVPPLGRRILLLNARQVFYESDRSANILLAIEDVTERRLVARERDELLHQKDLLLAEMQHRVANSLSIIASILLLKARTVSSAETRAHLEDARNRVMSVATVQKHLQPAHAGASIELRPYLTQLCSGLAGSMVNDEFCSIDTKISEGAVTSAGGGERRAHCHRVGDQCAEARFPGAEAGMRYHCGLRGQRGRLETQRVGQWMRRERGRLASRQAWFGHLHRQRACRAAECTRRCYQRVNGHNGVCRALDVQIASESGVKEVEPVRRS
jgi:hypothetical protein